MGAPLGNTNRKTHGIHSFIDRGPASLNPFEAASLDELRELVKTPEGRKAARDELLAREIMIVRMAMDQIAAHQHDQDVFTSGVAARAATWFEALRRLLDSYGADPERTQQVIEAALKNAIGDESGRTTD